MQKGVILATKQLKYWSQEDFDSLSRYVNTDQTYFRAAHTQRRQPNQREMIQFIADTLDLSFSQMLLKMIDARGLTDVEVYKTARIDRRVFSKIRSNDDYQPSRDTAILLCFALHLTLVESMALLERAGLCLSRSKKEDLVIMYCLDYGIYDVEAVNEALKNLGLRSLL